MPTDFGLRPLDCLNGVRELSSKYQVLTTARPRVPPDFRIPFSLGMLITLAGAFWDAWRHLNGEAANESLLNPFLNPAHGTIYGGAAIVAVSVVLLKLGRLSLPISVSRKAWFAMLAGIVLLLGGGLYDFWWHNTFGFADTTPWTPSHMTATAGFVFLMATGVAALSRSSGRLVKAALALSVLLFVSLWATVILLT